MSLKLDVAVIGAGPAGSTVANLLSQTGMRVALIERSNGPVARLRETAPAFDGRLNHRLKIEGVLHEALSEPEPLRMFVPESSFGITLQAQGTLGGDDTRGQCLHRTRFDALLTEAACRAGAILMRDTHIKEVSVDNASGYTTLHSKIALQARIVVDASGKSAFMANALKLASKSVKLDARLTFFAHFDMSAEDIVAIASTTTLVAHPGGYILVSRLSEGRLAVVTVTGEQHGALRSGATVFWNAVSSWPDLETRLRQANPVLPVLPAKNSEICYRSVTGDSFALVGDAAGFKDPFQCDGVARAMRMGEHLADAIGACFSAGEVWHQSDHSARYTHAVRRLEEQTATVDLQATLPGAHVWADPHIPWHIPLLMNRVRQPTIPPALLNKRPYDALRGHFDAL